MWRQNKEFRIALTLLMCLAMLITAAGFAFAWVTGILAAITSAGVLTAYCIIERYRYQKLKKLSWDLDNILTSGQSLSIGDYQEGELSVLANQIEKITLRLTESAEAVTAEKQYLADSLADITHQLRTPLTTLNLTVAMLQDPALSYEKRMELVREMRSLLHRTQWLADTLLKLSKLDAGTVLLKQEPVFLKDLVSRAASPIIIPLELRKQVLSIHCGNESFLGDPIWSAEALGNILKNCMEHTPEGGSITIHAEETPLFTQLEIMDSGPGFDSKDIPHLFERFYKGKNAAENSYGIGLAFARTVIRAQNGTVKAANTPDGAKFTIKFYKQVI